MTMTAVQVTVSDTFGALFAGQLADHASNAQELGVNSYRSETAVVAGRGVVKGTANAQNDSILTPFGVKTPLSGSVLADVVGIAVLTGALTQDASNNAVANRTTTMVSVAEVGSGRKIGAKTNAAVVHGDPVYMSVSHASIPVGEFTNASGAGLIAITGSTWYGAAASGTIGRIKL